MRQRIAFRGVSGAALVVAFLSAFAPEGAGLAQPYRLRADALSSVREPTGLLVLSGEAHPRSWIGAEAVVWTGALARSQDGLDMTGDALVAAVRLRDPGGLGDAKVGRFVLATGAVRPIHIDGALARARLPAGMGLEAFGGLPVVPEFGLSADDWLVGGRASESVADLLVVGVSYLHRRIEGDRADEEAGADLAVSPTRWLDFASRGSYDLIQTGPSEVQVSAAARVRPFRIEAYGTRRSPSRLLPATSIFSALGDVPSDQVGLAGTWYAAPRLDARLSGAARWAGGDLGAEGKVGATLRLDDMGAGALTAEARRTTVAAPWWGVRVGARIPLVGDLHASTELELVIPDDSQDRGELWPWALAGLGWRFADAWEAAAAVEAGASPEYLQELTALARVSYQWETL